MVIVFLQITTNSVNVHEVEGTANHLYNSQDLAFTVILTMEKNW